MQFHPSYHLAGASPLPVDMGYLFLVGSNILLLMVMQHQVVMLEFSQEEMSSLPSTLTSCKPEIKLQTSDGSKKKRATEFLKNIYFCFIDSAKAFDCVDHNKLWKILQEMGITDHLICLLRNLYEGQEATVRTGHRTAY